MTLHEKLKSALEARQKILRDRIEPLINKMVKEEFGEQYEFKFRLG